MKNCTNEASWVYNYMKPGMKFKVYDNSYCFEVLDNGVLEKVCLAPGTCEIGENSYELVITKITTEVLQHDTIFEKRMPVVYLHSNKSKRSYKVGVCWNELCAKGYNF